MRKKTVIILGATGMVGETIYLSFKNDDRFITVGASRNKDSFEIFEASHLESDLKKIIEKLEKVDFVINCIGLVNSKKRVKELIKVNSFFPQDLAEYLNKLGIRLIHISSDAVYSNDSFAVNESTVPSPQTLYGASKLLGEPDKSNTISIRTSIIGTSKRKINGLLDWARKSKIDKIEGYTNQNWSGCTSLQLAMFCKSLILNNIKSSKIYGNVINFVPLKSLSKYEILIAAQKTKIIKAKVVKKQSPNPITRNLTSTYFDTLDMSSYTSDINKALKELVDFNKLYV